MSRWLDACLAAPGRAICVAAGNAGQDKAETEGDLGWIMGRIHAERAGACARVSRSSSNGPSSATGSRTVSENELEIWYGAQDRFTVSVKPPGSATWITVSPREFVENRRLPSGTTRLDLQRALPPDQRRQLRRDLPVAEPRARQLPRHREPACGRSASIGDEIRDGRFNAWIERDDPGELEPIGGRRRVPLPVVLHASRPTSTRTRSARLACGHRVIAVANLDDARQRINATSSQGPTRDGRCKPEIAAPGTDIVAANGFAHPDEPWIAMTGTSMASPYVAGVVGLMLAANPQLTVGAVRRHPAAHGPAAAGRLYEWGNDAGFGRIDAEAAVEEAASANERESSHAVASTRPEGRPTMKLHIFQSAQGDCLLLEGGDERLRPV